MTHFDTLNELLIPVFGIFVFIAWGFYVILLIGYILSLFVPGGKGRCRIYIHISLPYSFQDVPRTEHVHMYTEHVHIFGHFIEFGLFSWPDTVYNDSKIYFNILPYVQVLSESS